MSVYNNRKYIIENNNLATNYSLINVLCQQPYGFQVIYLESYAYLLNFDCQQTHQALKQALRYKLTQSGLKTDILKSLDIELLDISSHIVTNNKQLAKAKLQYYKAYQRDTNNRNDQTSIKLHDLLHDALKAKTTEKINHLKNQLQQQAHDNPSNFWVAFDMAWFYFHIEQDMLQAEKQLIQAADYALQEESPLATHILRYLAYTKLILGQHEDALESIQAITQHAPQQQDQAQTIFESVLFHSVTENDYKQQIILQKLIKKNPVYYLYTQIDECLSSHKNIQSLLLRFHLEKLEQIKQCAQQKWQTSHFYQSTLPKDFDKEAFFHDHYQSYQALLSHQTYPVLCKIDTISDKIIHQLMTSADKHLTMTQTRYIKDIIETQKQWKKINQLGGILIYAAIIISFASIFLWVTAVIVNAPILLDIDWKHILPKLVMIISGSAFIGLLLMRSTPPTNRKRFKYTRLITQALKAIKKPPSVATKNHS